MRASKHPDLLNAPVKGLFLHYLMPSIAATLVTSIYIFADTVFIGHGVGADGIAALNVVLPLFSVLFGVGLLFGVGGSVMMSVCFGKGDTDAGKRCFTLSLCALGASFAAVFVLLLTCFDGIMRLFGATDELMPLIREYGMPFVYSSAVFMLSSYLQAFVRNDKAPKTAMAGVITGGVVNIILDYLFIFPLGMGMFGAAIASVIGSGLGVLVFCTHFFSPKNNLKLKGGFSAGMLKKLVFTGFPSFMIEMASGIVVSLFNLILVKLAGKTGIAAYGILSNSAIIIMSLSNGVAQAVQPIVSTNYGAKKYDRIKSVIKMGAVTSAALGIIFMAAGELFPAAISSVFVETTPEILKIASPAVRIYFCSFLLLPLNVLAGGCFQSLMKPKHAFMITALRGLIICTALLAVLPAVFGVNGVWAVMPLTELITFAFAAFFAKGVKRKPV